MKTIYNFDFLIAKVILLSFYIAHQPLVSSLFPKLINMAMFNGNTFFVVHFSNF